jgi:hypothetical protein
VTPCGVRGGSLGIPLPEARRGRPIQHVFHLADVEVIGEVIPREGTQLRIGIDGALADEEILPFVATETWQAEYWATRSALKGYLDHNILREWA